MRQVDIVWESARERFVATGAGGQQVLVNAPHADEGTGRTGISPAELLLAAAGTCSGWDVVEILRKQRQDVEGVEVRVTGLQDDEAPWTFRQIDLEFTIRGRSVAADLAERAVRLSEERYCSVTSTLRLGTRVTSTVHVVEVSPADASAEAVASALGDHEPE